MRDVCVVKWLLVTSPVLKFETFASDRYHRLEVLGEEDLAPRARKLHLEQLSPTKRISLHFLGVALLDGQCLSLIRQTAREL